MATRKVQAMAFGGNYKGKRVLITGHTGFKGSWLSIWLGRLGAELYGYALSPEKRSLYNDAHVNKIMTEERFADIGRDVGLAEYILRIKPDFIFHLAAEAIVGRAHENPIDTWQTNIIGTLRLLETLRREALFTRVVIITSDKCYENMEWVWGYREDDRLGGKDMYSSSKAAVELLISSFKRSYLDGEDPVFLVASARAGNVIGGGDWSEYRLVPDCMRSWEEGKSVLIRNPRSTRPWQHVLEPLRGYLCLGSSLCNSKNIHGEAFNFGPDASNSKTVEELVLELETHWSDVQWKLDSGRRDFNECSLLALNCDKAAALLNWRPLLGFRETAEMTSSWYSRRCLGASASELCNSQLDFYEERLS